MGDDARETLTIAGLGKAEERSLERYLRLRAPQTWVVLCASVDQYLRTTVDSSAVQLTPMEIGAVVSICACFGKSGHEKVEVLFAHCKVQHCGETGHLKKMCRQREKYPSSSSGKGSGKSGKSHNTTDKCY